MSYLVIDPAGPLHHHRAHVTADAIRAEMPSGGFALVRLRGQRSLFAFVDDVGHKTGLLRNSVGSCLIALLGASTHAYAGPVVITGWQEPDESDELRDLDAVQVKVLSALHGAVVAAINGSAEPRPFEPYSTLSADEIRAYAQWVQTSPTPETRVIRLDGGRS